MREVFCDTSPLQYLHQLGLLQILPSLVGRIVVPPAVVRELQVGRHLGIDVPDLATLEWVEVRHPPKRTPEPLSTDLGPGETETLLLALDSPSSVALLDDARAREVATALAIQFSGTLGILLDAKRDGLIPAIRPALERLQALGFRLAAQTRTAVLRMAGEEADA